MNIFAYKLQALYGKTETNQYLKPLKNWTAVFTQKNHKPFKKPNPYATRIEFSFHWIILKNWIFIAPHYNRHRHTSIIYIGETTKDQFQQPPNENRSTHFSNERC